MKEQKLKEDKVTMKSENSVKLNDNFKDDVNGIVWYLVPRETLEWPNGNPRKALYENLIGNRLVIWLNEVGGMIYNRVLA